MPSSTFDTWVIFVIVAIVLSGILRFALGRYQLRTGRTTYPVTTACFVLVGLPALGWLLVGGSPLDTDLPVLGRFNFSGGMQLTPEYAAVLTGLVVYTSAFIAEVVRAGILAVNRGQFEAARAEKPYRSFLPEDSRPPTDLNKELMDKWRPFMEKHFWDDETGAKEK